jgi:dolichol-phosphate mannosyltransferase
VTIWVALPAYNEGPRLGALLRRWADVLAAMGRTHRYVVVDDGSTDDTADVIKRFAEDQPVDVITHDPNQGLGASLRDALMLVADRAADDDVVVMMDADNTHSPEQLPLMLDRMREASCDVVIASRYRPGALVEDVSLLRRFVSFGARVLFQVTFPIRGVRDYTCGFRLYRVAVIKRAFEVYGGRFCDRSGFECTADIILRLARVGASFSEIGIALRYGAKEGDSHMRVGRTMRATLSLMAKRRFERR